jgi:glycosyltransferase involved in cell wall biosynthesis
MKVAFDATPLIGRRTGIGRYAAGLAQALPQLGDTDLVLTAFTWRGLTDLDSFVGPHVSLAPHRAPARLLAAAWSRGDWPPIEVLSGRVDIVHGTNFTLPPARHAARVVTVHDLAFLTMPDTVDAASLTYRTSVPTAVREAHAVLTVSQAVAGQVCDTWAIDPARVHVTPNALSDDFLAGPSPLSDMQRIELGLPEQFVIFVGTVEPRKNLAVLVDAWDAAADLPPLVVVGGSGWGEQEHLRRLAASRVHFIDYVPPQRLAPLVARASLLVLPSRDEGFGIPPLEALACGVPVVVSDLPVLREVLGEHARYVSPDDVEGWISAVSQVVASPPDRQAGVDHARGFTWHRSAQLTRAAYLAALEARG